MLNPTEIVLDHPWIAPLLWAVLHSLDYSLTLVGARLRQRRAAEVVEVSGSYELNPLFQRAVDRGRWLSPRFLVTLFGIAAVLWLAVAACPVPEAAWGIGFVLGVIVFTRVAVIGRHLQNIWLYARMARRPGSVTGRISYDRPTIYGLAVFSYGQTAALLAVAAAVAPDPWVVGGAAGTALVSGYSAVLGLVAGRKRPAEGAVSTGAGRSGR